MAKKAENEVALAGETLPAANYDWEQDAGVGLEDVKSKDLSLPIWRLLQSSSPECKRLDPKYVVDAVEGRWLDTLRREVCDWHIFIPCRYQTQIIRWKPRDSGGGMVKNFGLDDSILRECQEDDYGRYFHPSGDEIIPTPTWYGLVMQTALNDEIRDVPAYKAVMTFTSTQAKVSRKWLNAATSISVPGRDGKRFTPPLYYCAYRIGSLGQQNDQGSWAIATVDRHGLTSHLWPDVVPLCREFAELTKSQAVLDHVAEQMNADRQSTTTAGQVVDDEIPF